ncbi:MAG: AmmeMemoRadiSam system protein B, partial [Dehalococcoidia bacterium]|nr:AmmeMemoRadiSam system protein B [Dehalococcoidia bacterium]
GFWQKETNPGSNGQVRSPAVAGAFYPGNAGELRQLVERCFKHSLGPGSLPRVIPGGKRSLAGLVCPHAGLIYSGPVAAHGYFQLASRAKPERVVILGPNHHGYGPALSLSAALAWETPLGRIAIDGEGAKKLLAGNPALRQENDAHVYEHSLEVQLPFLQYLYGEDFKIIPIAMSEQGLAESTKLGLTIAGAFPADDTVVIASSDFSHYEPQAAAEKLDGLAIKAIEKMDGDGLFSAIARHGITMCGPGPVTAAMAACRQWGVTEARLLRYATSGDVSGDYSRVVGYASISMALPEG